MPSSIFGRKSFERGLPQLALAPFCVCVEEEEEREKRKGEEEERVGFGNRGRVMGVENKWRMVSVCKYWKKPLS